MCFCVCNRKRLMDKRLFPDLQSCAIPERRKNTISGRNDGIFSAVRVSRGCGGAAFVLQRGRCCNAVRPPPQPGEALTAKPEPFRHASGVFPPF